MTLGELKAESAWWPWTSVDATDPGWGCLSHWVGIEQCRVRHENKSSSKPQVILNRKQFLFEALLFNNSTWGGVCSVCCWISFPYPLKFNQELSAPFKFRVKFKFLSLTSTVRLWMAVVSSELCSVSVFSLISACHQKDVQDDPFLPASNSSI